ncbi:MAG TPA: PQQ-binding-like beta-propeller repeat protein [Actinoplanes sp.]|nr:PQQ-binding-like beta-propeller repeat protein [Actinoplanes sp.]
MLLLLAAFIGLVVLAGVALSATRYLFSRSDEPSVAGPAMTKVWTVGYPGPPTDDDRPVAVWAAGELVVRVQADGVFAYRAGDGQQAWALPAPTGKLICAADATSAGTLGAMLIGTAKNCGTVIGFDLVSGRQRWSTKLGRLEITAGRLIDDRPPISVTADRVIVADPYSKLRALNADNGRVMWSRQSPSSWAVDDQHIVLTSTRSLTDRRPQVESLDPQTGKRKWRIETPGQYPARVAAANPPVLMHIHDDPNVQLFTEAGALVATLPATYADGLTIDMISGDGVRTHGTNAYLSMRTADSSGELVTAFDSTTGKEVWRSDPIEIGSQTAQASDGSIVALDDGSILDDGPSRLLRIGATDGKTQTLGAVRMPELRQMSSWDRLLQVGDTWVLVPESRRGNNPALIAFR